MNDSETVRLKDKNGRGFILLEDGDEKLNLSEEKDFELLNEDFDLDMDAYNLQHLEQLKNKFSREHTNLEQ